jgi:hypothetical protein
LFGPSERAATRVRPVGKAPVIWTGLLALAAFCTAPDDSPPLSRLSALQVTSAPGAGIGAARSVDLVWVFDSDTLAQMPGSGADWFAGKAGLSDGMKARLDILEVDMAGGGTQTPALPARHAHAIAVLAYDHSADASSRGSTLLTDYECARIVLGATTAFAHCN